MKIHDDLSHASELFGYFKQIIQKYLNQYFKPELKNKNDEILVKTYAKEWNLFTLFSNHLKKLFDYLVSLYFLIKDL